MKKLMVIISMVTMIVALAACANANNSASSSSGEKESTQGKKVIVVYFSGSGNTKRVAELAADELKADTFEIVPAQPYSEADLNWTNSESRVNKEHNDVSLQNVLLVSDKVTNWSDYNVVLIGYPIWWRDAAWVINGFVQNNDFSGKQVIPFCTSTSSELGSSGTNLEKMAGTGEWKEGKRFTENPDESEVRQWARELNPE
ncbi:MAG: flavodoxin [Eubacteriaceae bacterium]|nr:flavodoxin [Eubacteriaceae bacterium]